MSLPTTGAALPGMPDNNDDDDIRTQRTQRGFARPNVTAPPSQAPSPVGKEPTTGFEPTAGFVDQPTGGLDEDTVKEGGEPSAPQSDVLLPPSKPSSIYDTSPLVEIEVLHQHGPAPRMDQPAHVVEVWTQNRVYTMDASMQCVAVVNRASNERDYKHSFLGQRLVGGQHRDGETFELSYPYPRPGTEAVFEDPNTARSRFSRTSTVQRVVLRLHVVTVAQTKLVPTWADITEHEGTT